MQSALHLETAEKKQQEGPESMPLLSRMPNISGLAALTLAQNGSERLPKERTRRVDIETAREGRLFAIWRWVASARTYRCRAAASSIPTSDVASPVLRQLPKAQISAHGSRPTQL